ncbi:hypothetical protein P3S67_021111 [Capsicum chacoense]
MNRESGPSFSLRVSQLECFKEFQEVVNFRAVDFDNEIDDFHENWSKHRNDPQTMKKLRQKLAKKDKKKESGSKKRGHNNPESKTPVKRRIVVEEICRDELPKELSYVLKEISSHPLRFVSLCNLRFKDEIKEVVEHEVLHLFKKTIFRCYLNISISNYIGQITKYILMIEIEQSNQEEIHVFVKGQILRFSINEFALIIGLNCFGNVDDFNYEDFSLSRLMKRYFLQSINGVDKEALVEHFLKENFENKEDALQMAILYFIHTFIYSQLNASPVSFFDFKMVEDGKYQFFPWVKQEDMEEKSKVDDDSTSTLSRKDLVVKADLHSLESEMKAFMKTYRLINARFTEVLNSLEQKNETVKQKIIVKQSRQECDPSNDVVDDAGPTRTDSVVKETDKSIEMEDDKVNQAPLFLKKIEQHEKDIGIEKQSDIVVEKIQPLESIISGREHDLALMIYKPPPTTSAEYEISDTAILSAFSIPQKNVSANKNAHAPRSRKPSKIYRSPLLTHFRSSSKGKKKLAFVEPKKYPFEGYHITEDSPTVKMKIFEEWIHDGLYEQHMKKKDNDDHYKN